METVVMLNCVHSGSTLSAVPSIVAAFLEEALSLPEQPFTRYGAHLFAHARVLPGHTPENQGHDAAECGLGRGGSV